MCRAEFARSKTMHLDLYDRGVSLEMRALLIFVLATALTAAGIACGNDGDLAHEVVYVSQDENHRMFLLDRSGNETEVVNEWVYNPKWSPNQRVVAYLSDARGGSGQLKTWDRNSENSERVPDAPAHVTEFFWSPDSRMITYQATSPEGDTTNVYLHHFENETTQLLASEPTGNIELGNWSGDNAWIAMRLKFENTQGIFIRSVEGVDEVQLTDYNDSRPRFSRDGRRVALARHKSNGETDLHVLTIDPETGPGSAIALSDDDGDETDFEWSPGGRRIFYVSAHDGNPEIYSVDVETKVTRRMTQNRVDDAGPRWSNDGSRILFRSNIDGNFDLFTMDVESGAQSRVLANDANIIAADW